MATVSALHAGQYAVIATINDYPGTAGDLQGCNADGDAFAQLLVQRFGFTKNNIRRLKDAEVTTANIRKNLQEQLLAKAHPGDAAVFFYSGHGTQVPDMDGDERDESDEAICTYDMDASAPNEWLTDDVLRHELSLLKTNRVTIVLDCCHSGTGTRGVESDAAAGVRYFDLGFGRRLDIYRDLSVSTGMKTPSNNPQHVLLAACASHEIAREEWSKGGYFTLALVKALDKGGDASPLEELYGGIREDIARRMFKWSQPRKQTPQIEGDARVSLKTLLGAQAPAGSPLSQVPEGVQAAPPPEVTNAGSIQGDVAISLTTDKSEYAAGEHMSVSLNVSQDSHLRLYYTDGEQKSYLIFPNKFHPSDEVKAEEQVRLPAAGAAFAFEMTHPADRGAAPVSEILTAVASIKPFTDTRSLKWDSFNFIECTGQSYHDMLTRGIEMTPEVRPGRAATIYRVKAKQ